MNKKSYKPFKRLSVIVKPTHLCNLSCNYCYIDSNAEKGVMSNKTLENLIFKTVSTHKSVSFIWHGGEPLLIPLDFYKNAKELQEKFFLQTTPAEIINKIAERKKGGDKKSKGLKRMYHPITNGFQSNGTLITDAVLDFCEEYDFDIGFSLDGPKEINDKTRYFKNNESAFKKILRGIKKAKKRKVGGGAIVVVNKLNINHLTKIYEFAKKEDINLKLNPLIKSGNACKNYEDLGISPREYGNAMVDLFDKWFYDSDNLRLDPFEELIGNILTENPWGCNYSTSCQNSFISVGPQGDVYPCGRFDGVKEFQIGNINENSMEEIINNAKRKQLQNRADNLKVCQPCEYKKICNSGCMHNAYMSRGRITDRDYYCASYKILFKHISEKIGVELDKAKVGG